MARLVVQSKDGEVAAIMEMATAMDMGAALDILEMLAITTGKRSKKHFLVYTYCS